MSRTIVRSLVLAAVLVLASATTGVASAGSHVENSTQADASTHTHVEMHADESGLVLRVAYEGEGSALVTIEGTDARYADGGSYDVAGERIFRLQTPEIPSGIEVTVETPHSEVTRTIEYGTVADNCGVFEESVRLPERITYEWTVEYGNETYSDERTHELPTPEVPCPDVPIPDGANESDGGEFEEWSDNETDDREFEEWSDNDEGAAAFGSEGQSDAGPVFGPGESEFGDINDALREREQRWRERLADGEWPGDGRDPYGSVTGPIEASDLGDLYSGLSPVGADEFRPARPDESPFAGRFDGLSADLGAGLDADGSVRVGESGASANATAAARAGWSVDD